MCYENPQKFDKEQYILNRLHETWIGTADLCIESAGAHFEHLWLMEKTGFCCVSTITGK